MRVLTDTMVITILPHVSGSNQHAARLQLIRCYMSIMEKIYFKHLGKITVLITELYCVWPLDVSIVRNNFPSN